MKDDQFRFLTLRQMPARLNVEQVAWMLNCQPHDLPVLVSKRLLKPLGNPPPNAIKYFATVDVQEHAKDRDWLAKVTSAVTRHWQLKNARQRAREAALAQAK